MKGVVLAGGSGSRLRPLTFSMAKQLIPVANKPIIEYGLEDLARAGIEEVGVIISPETGAELRAAVGDGARLGLHLTYIVQDRPLGLAHALKTALPFVDGDDCLMYLGDNLLKDGVRDVVADFAAYRPNCQILLCPVENPSSFGVAELGEGGRIVRLVEKPKIPPSDLALVGVYLFDGSIAEAVDAIAPSARGELEITDAIQYLVDSGRRVRASIVRNWWKDTGTKADLLAAQELIIAELTERIEGELVGCRSRGAVQVGEGSRLVDCDLTGPVVVGRDVQLARVRLGPQASVGDGCRLSDASVEGSIVMDGAEVHGWKIRASVIGRGARLAGSAPGGFAEVTLGERSEILGE
ncbi:MAG TPA: glucose-1-phosphate thymidylyltransferase [Acidimicrobiia bacterium]|nr:glucose-1-phosphate thymidylyltransferase [Acidimicrobiia bacterium]